MKRSFLLEEDDVEIVALIQKMEPLIKANKCDEVYETLLPIVQKELPLTLNTARLYKQFITGAAIMNDYNIEYYVETAVSIFENILCIAKVLKRNYCFTICSTNGKNIKNVYS